MGHYAAPRGWVQCRSENGDGWRRNCIQWKMQWNQMHRVVCGVVLGICVAAPAQQAAEVDTDRDGLSDTQEQALLEQFAPTLMVARGDCSVVPAEFARDIAKPTVVADNGTVYGQATPYRAGEGREGEASPFAAQSLVTEAEAKQAVELHFYHLWRSDCGPGGHHLDTEHVAALVTPYGVSWKALYWYAAAHEATLCDASQIARASTLRAEDAGATIWVSPGKHASYLHPELCRHGCGVDRCVAQVELSPGPVVNLGELDRPMNGSAFLHSHEWPLATKMTTTNFPANAVARLELLPATDIAWFNAGSHPVQHVIAAGSTATSSTGDALALSSANTSASLALAGRSTDSALTVAQSSTGNALNRSFDNTSDALGRSYDNTKHALGKATRSVGRALGMGRGDGEPKDSAEKKQR